MQVGAVRSFYRVRASRQGDTAFLTMLAKVSEYLATPLGPRPSNVVPMAVRCLLLGCSLGAASAAVSAVTPVQKVYLSKRHLQK